MSSQIPFPNKRLVQAGLGNPLFITDIENANEDLLEALAVLYGFASNGFAILSGFDYGAGAYTGGIVYMNGVFYRCVAGLTENQYLTPDVQDVDNKIFSDANTYPTYRIYQAVAAGAQWGGMPQFVGNMNGYRVSIKKVYDLAVQVVNATENVRGIAQLASSAEVIAGTDTQKIVTPAGLAARTATDERKGIIEIATSAETQTGTDAERAVTPAALSARTATDTRTGLIELATNAEVQAGTDAERAVTPATLAFRDGAYNTVIFPIGNWNMDADPTITIDDIEIPFENVDFADCTIYIDPTVAGRKYDLKEAGLINIHSSDSGVQYTKIVLERTTGGRFDSTAFDQTPFNRGQLRLQYKQY